MTDKTSPIDQTRKWLSSVIIAHDLCPFASREFEAGRIHYELITAGDMQGQLEAIIMACAALDKQPQRETSLLVFPKGLDVFEDYLDLLDLANGLLEQQGYEGTYQLASFHPAYRFADAALDDPANFTNRSPYPLVHILREASVEAALKTYPNPENIPDRNIQLMQGLGLSAVKASLAACLK